MMIVAGGEATRLGPLAAQMNKALVSVQQRPMIAHLMARAVESNVDKVTIVVSPDSQGQVTKVLNRMGTELPWTITVQPSARGPVDAIQYGLAVLDRGKMGDDDQVIITFADSYFDSMPPGTDEPNWVGVRSVKPGDRSWCYLDDLDTQWHDGIPALRTTAFIGVLQASVSSLRKVVSHVIYKHGNNVGMAPVLTELDVREVVFPSWQDVGDIAALAAARRASFTCRSKHQLRLDDRGVLTKTGVTTHEAAAAARMESLLLGPRLVPSPSGVLAQEFIDLPSLAELYLYWPGRPDMWKHIIEVITGRLELALWIDVTSKYREQREADDQAMIDAAVKMYITKPNERLERVSLPPMSEAFTDYLANEVVPTTMRAPIHGDLNFGNILYSLGTDTFKLVDARGDWGGLTTVGDVRYELAKLRYSYRDGFSAITHGLTVKRDEESAAMDEVIERHAKGQMKRIAAIEATLFYSAIPLHLLSEREALLRAGQRLEKEVLA